MFKLCKAHLDAFEAQVVRMFSARVIEHVNAIWPAECAELGPETVSIIVHNAIQRAAMLGLILEADIVRFVDLSFILGVDFDTNPLANWARPILADRSWSPTEKMDRLYAAMDQEFLRIEKRGKV